MLFLTILFLKKNQTTNKKKQHSNTSTNTKQIPNKWPQNANQIPTKRTKSVGSTGPFKRKWSGLIAGAMPSLVTASKMASCTVPEDQVEGWFCLPKTWLFRDKKCTWWFSTETKCGFLPKIMVNQLFFGMVIWFKLRNTESLKSTNWVFKVGAPSFLFFQTKWPLLTKTLAPGSQVAWPTRTPMGPATAFASSLRPFWRTTSPEASWCDSMPMVNRRSMAIRTSQEGKRWKSYKGDGGGWQKWWGLKLRWFLLGS